MSHTPTPWKIDSAVPGAPEIVTDKGRRIAVVLFHGASEDTYPNAAFIVEACNAHERLKRERDALRTQVESVVAHTEAAPTNPLPIHVFQACLKALALCEEGGKG